MFSLLFIIIIMSHFRSEAVLVRQSTVTKNVNKKQWMVVNI